MPKSSKTFPIIDAMAASIAVDRKQGFIKSGYGYYDYDNCVNVLDNKTLVNNVLNSYPEVENKVNVLESDRTEAEELIAYFSDVIVEKKMLGTISGFEDTVGKIINGDVVDAYGIAILASLPNSLRVQEKRDSLEDFYADHRGISEYVGKTGDRIGMTVDVVDVKYISKYNIHLVTSTDSNDNIISFFWNKDPDIANLIEGKQVSIVGTIRKQEVSKFSGCKETVVNRVKITDKSG